MEEKNVAIQVHGLQKSYKKSHVLKGVDFDVARGSIFALLGSNGGALPTRRTDKRAYTVRWLASFGRGLPRPQTGPL